jgi:hypothetical protein
MTLQWLYGEISIEDTCLTIILWTFNSVFVLLVWNFLRDGPLNRRMCLTVSVYILWTDKYEIMK